MGWNTVPGDAVFSLTYKQRPDKIKIKVDIFNEEPSGTIRADEAFPRGYTQNG